MKPGTLQMEKFDQVFFDNTLLPPGHYMQYFINILPTPQCFPCILAFALLKHPIRIFGIFGLIIPFIPHTIAPDLIRGLRKKVKLFFGRCTLCNLWGEKLVGNPDGFMRTKHQRFLLAFSLPYEWWGFGRGAVLKPFRKQINSWNFSN